MIGALKNVRNRPFAGIVTHFPRNEQLCQNKFEKRKSTSILEKREVSTMKYRRNGIQWTIPQLTKILISTSLDKIPSQHERASQN
jgi:hypothetical protein